MQRVASTPPERQQAPFLKLGGDDDAAQTTGIETETRAVLSRLALTEAVDAMVRAGRETVDLRGSGDRLRLAWWPIVQRLPLPGAGDRPSATGAVRRDAPARNRTWNFWMKGCHMQAFPHVCWGLGQLSSGSEGLLVPSSGHGSGHGR
jgi:hypothetical protein